MCDLHARRGEKRVLIVDDDSEACEWITGRLEHFGYTTLVVVTNSRAVLIIQKPVRRERKVHAAPFFLLAPAYNLIAKAVSVCLNLCSPDQNQSGILALSKHEEHLIRQLHQ